jgi:hypothetical protein
VAHRLVGGTARHAGNPPIGRILTDRDDRALVRASQIDGDSLSYDSRHRDAATPGRVLQIAVHALGKAKVGRDVAGHL